MIFEQLTVKLQSFKLDTIQYDKYTVSQKTGPLRIIRHNFTNS